MFFGEFSLFELGVIKDRGSRNALEIVKPSEANL